MLFECIRATEDLPFSLIDEGDSDRQRRTFSTAALPKRSNEIFGHNTLDAVKLRRTHTLFGFIEGVGVPAASFRVFTMLRDPIDRFLSAVTYFHYFDRVNDNNALGKAVFKGLASGREGFVDAEIAEKLFKQTNGGQLYAHEPISVFGIKQTLALGVQKKRKGGASTVFFPTDENLEHAKHYLRNHTIVGAIEDIDSFLVLLSLEFGWPLDKMCRPFLSVRSQAAMVARREDKSIPKGEKKGVVSGPGLGKKNPNARAYFSPEGLAYIEHALRHELALYEYAKQLHAEQLRWVNSPPPFPFPFFSFPSPFSFVLLANDNTHHSLNINPPSFLPSFLPFFLSCFLPSFLPPSMPRQGR
jgi:hypothetical protein